MQNQRIHGPEASLTGGISRRKFLIGAAGIASGLTVGAPRAFAHLESQGDSRAQGDEIASVEATPVVTPTIEVVVFQDTPLVTEQEIIDVAAALNIQVVRDFHQFWGINAVVSPCPTGVPAPKAAWKIRVKDNVTDSGHFFDPVDFLPYAKVNYQPGNWSKAASHECLEMLANPYFRRFHMLPSPKEGQGDVLFLQEVCDPCKSDDASYFIGKVRVSDFVSRTYFDPGVPYETGDRFDFTGKMVKPQDILIDCYQNWRIPGTNESWRSTKTATGFDHEKNATVSG